MVHIAVLGLFFPFGIHNSLGGLDDEAFVAKLFLHTLQFHLEACLLLFQPLDFLVYIDQVLKGQEYFHPFHHDGHPSSAIPSLSFLTTASERWKALNGRFLSTVNQDGSAVTNMAFAFRVTGQSQSSIAYAPDGIHDNPMILSLQDTGPLPVFGPFEIMILSSGASAMAVDLLGDEA